ncbi:MAG: response regulator [Helicobacteraceae bacterium]|nr:response regulator [Helicobacteraceae bacterium]
MSLLEHVDGATNLAKNNELQLLVFKVNDQKKESPFYAINVFKTREVIESNKHRMTQIPSANPLLEGTIVLRGMQLPVLNLAKWVGQDLSLDQLEKSNILICDFNGIVIGLRIMYAHRVIKKNWNEIHAPSAYSSSTDGAKVMNHTRLDDGSLCLILDYERLLSEVIPQAMVNLDVVMDPTVVIPAILRNGTVLIAEDSKVAQKHLKIIFTKLSLDFIIFDNGKLMMDHIEAIEDPEATIPAIVTDIEMPEMSGFTVLRLLKANPKTQSIPVIVNSSMTGENNKREAEVLGADAFISKTKSQDIVPLIISLLEAK